MNENKMEEALQNVKKVFSKNDTKIGILYSGGKDSTAVLLTIAKEFPDAELYLYALNNGCMYPEEIKNKVK
jgi:3'-phosphoadenosine 5'-phosphosulfate sulfotransferase (PAPS reductase)/FAD synthetase